MTMYEDIIYHPETGKFSGLPKEPYMFGGSKQGGEYLALQINRKPIYLHRLAFFLMIGRWPKYVDHINGNKLDNRWCNLREATMAENKANEGLRSTNTSGLKGVSWHKAANKWRSYIGDNIHLGLFDCPAAAHLTYLIEAHKRYGKFARGA